MRLPAEGVETPSVTLLGVPPVCVCVCVNKSKYVFCKTQMCVLQKANMRLLSSGCARVSVLRKANMCFKKANMCFEKSKYVFCKRQICVYDHHRLLESVFGRHRKVHAVVPT